MTDRRTFLALLAGSVVAPREAVAQVARRPVALYANVGPVLTRYEVNLATLDLIPRESVRLPSVVQYGWADRNRRHLYVASSSGGPARGNAQAGNAHYLTAFTIDSATSALSQIGESLRLPARPIHITLDHESQHVLVAFNDPSALRVYRINADFSPGAEVPQAAMNAGIYAHQVRVTPDGRHVVLVTRGNEGTAQRPEDPGALMVFDCRAGRLSNQRTIAPNGGRAYGPRHLDFHPSRPWMYVSVETQNQLHMHRLRNGAPLPDVVFNKTTLLEPQNRRSRQAASAVHVHPNGHVVYGANRSQDVVEFKGRQVFTGGENSIVVFAIDPQTGEPTAIQHVETRKIHPRTFHVDPSGRMLVAQHNVPVDVREGEDVRTVAAGLSVFRINGDGTLAFARTYDVEVGDTSMWWMGMV